jgi:hypothetical protein
MELRFLEVCLAAYHSLINQLLGYLSSPVRHTWHADCKREETNENREAEMAWIISVGRAGAKGRAAEVQAVSLRIDVEGIGAQVRVFPDAGRAAPGGAAAMPAWQAQRVWRNVLATLVET